MKAKSEMEKIIEELKAKDKRTPSIKKLSSNAWLCSSAKGFSAFTEFPALNEYISQFVERAGQERAALLTQKKEIKQIASLLFKENFEFMHVAHLADFCLLCVQKNYFKSLSFDLLALSALFKILEENLGNPAFETRHLLDSLFLLIICMKSQTTGFYFNCRVFRAFSRLFQKNRLLFMETQEIAESFFCFVFGLYAETLEELCELLSANASAGGAKKIFRCEPSFFLLCCSVLRPHYILFLRDNEQFMEHVDRVFKAFQALSTLLPKISAPLLPIYSDLFLTCLVFLRQKSLKKSMPIKLKTLMLRYFKLCDKVKKLEAVPQARDFFTHSLPLLYSLACDQCEEIENSGDLKLQFKNFKASLDKNLMDIKQIKTVVLGLSIII